MWSLQRLYVLTSFLFVQPVIKQMYCSIYIQLIVGRYTNQHTDWGVTCECQCCFNSISHLFYELVLNTSMKRFWLAVLQRWMKSSPQTLLQQRLVSGRKKKVGERQGKVKFVLSVNMKKKESCFHMYCVSNYRAKMEVLTKI